MTWGGTQFSSCFPPSEVKSNWPPRNSSVTHKRLAQNHPCHSFPPLFSHFPISWCGRPLVSTVSFFTRIYFLTPVYIDVVFLRPRAKHFSNFCLEKQRGGSGQARRNHRCWASHNVPILQGSACPQVVHSRPPSLRRTLPLALGEGESSDTLVPIPQP